MQFTTLVEKIGQLHDLSAIRQFLTSAFTTQSEAISQGSGVEIEYFLDTNSFGEKEVIAELHTSPNGSWTLIIHSKMEEPVEMRMFGQDTTINITEFLAMQSLAN